MLGQGKIDQFIVIEGEEPIPHVPERDPGDLGDPAVFNERTGIALSFEEGLEDHPLTPKSLAMTRALAHRGRYRNNQKRIAKSPIALQEV